MLKFLKNIAEKFFRRKIFVLDCEIDNEYIKLMDQIKLSCDLESDEKVLEQALVLLAWAKTHNFQGKNITSIDFDEMRY